MNEGNGGELPPDQTDSFRDDPHAPPPERIISPTAVTLGLGGSRTPPPPPPDDEDEDDGEEHGMLRMSFLEHLEELRSRIIKALYGFGVVFLACVFFSSPSTMFAGSTLEKVDGTFLRRVVCASKSAPDATAPFSEAISRA